MGEGRSRRWGTAARWGAVAVVGSLVGSVLIGPAMAHLNNPLTFKHLKSHFYTKKLANSTFINVGEAATSATSATNATNADKLDNLDSTAFQAKCAPGTVKAYAYIDATVVSATAFATTGVVDAFNCTGGGITAKRTATGVFQVKIPGITGAAGERIVTANAAESFCFFGCAGASEILVAYHDGNTDAGQQVIEFSVTDSEDNTGANTPSDDANGAIAANVDFAFAVYN
jgi:hypothetical protein